MNLESNQRDKINSLVDSIEFELDEQQNEIEDLEDSLDELSNEDYSNISDELKPLLNNANFDLGTVLDLKDVILDVLKKHGYGQYYS